MPGPWVALWGALLFMVVVGVAARVLITPYDWTSEEAAAWAQAVGSVVAVAATGGVVIWQDVLHRKAERRARFQARMDQLEPLLALTANLKDLFGAVRYDVGYFMEEYSSSAFEDIRGALVLVPVHELRDDNLTLEIMEVRRIANEVCQALPVFSSEAFAEMAGQDVINPDDIAVMDGKLARLGYIHASLRARYDRVAGKWKAAGGS